MAMDIGGGSGRGKRKRRATPEMNVTPLVDVVLVLLIIFMVVTPLLAKQFWITLPDRSDEPSPQAEPPLVVSVSSEGRIRINTEEVRDAELEPELRRILAARRSRTVFFDAADGADLGRAVEVLDMARGGGANVIAVATEPVPGIE